MKLKELLYGGLMFLGFIAFFFFMKSIDLYQNTYLRVFNGVIHIGIIWISMKRSRGFIKTAENYFKVFMVGLRTGLYGIIPFIIFQFFYLSAINPAFMVWIQNNAMLGSYLNPFNITVFLFIEGFGITFLSSYLIMRLYGIRKDARIETMQ